MILDWVFEILLNLSNFVHFGSQIIISLTNSRKRKPLSELFQRILHKTNSKEDSTYISYLADDMFLNITSFLDIREIYHFGCVDSKILLIIKENLQKLISQKKEWVLKYFPDTICNLMCGSTTLIFERSSYFPPSHIYSRMFFMLNLINYKKPILNYLK